MEIVKNNISKFSVCKLPQMYCFGGGNVSLPIQEIDKISLRYWCPNDENEPTVPVLIFQFKNGLQITVDYETEEEAKEILKNYQKDFLMKIVKD